MLLEAAVSSKGRLCPPWFGYFSHDQIIARTVLTIVAVANQPKTEQIVAWSHWCGRHPHAQQEPTPGVSRNAISTQVLTRSDMRVHVAGASGSRSAWAANSCEST